MAPRQKRPARLGIGYIRVSRKGKRGGDSYHTEEIQKAEIQAYAKAKGIRIVRWVQDINQSGKNAKRPGLMEVLDLIDHGSADTLVVARLSRFARSTKDALNILERIESEPYPGSLIACDVDVDTSTPVGKLLRTILTAVGEFEVELAAERWLEVQEKAMDDGIYPMAAPPGYKKNERRRLVLDPKVAPLIEPLFSGRAAGDSWAELHEAWKGAGGPPISRTGLMTVIENRAYLGETRYNGTVILDTHTALVTVELFDAAQAVKAPRRWRKRDGSLLAGTLVCSITDKPMTSGGTDKQGRKTYRCQPGSCSGHRQTVMQPWVDKIVEEELLAWSEEHVRELEGTAQTENLLIAATRNREAAEAELAAFVENASALDAAMFKLGVESRQAKVDEAREEEQRIKSERRVESVRISLGDVWPELDVEERRKLVTKAIEKVVVHPSSGARAGSYVSVERREQLVRERLTVVFRPDA